MTMTPPTTEAERLITEVMACNDAMLRLKRAPLYGVQTLDAAIDLLTEQASNALKLVAALRTSEEARVKAERERDEALARLPVEDECEDIRNRAEASETALADMRRERDAAEAALVWAAQLAEDCAAMPFEWAPERAEAITAARSRAKPDGEEKKL